jgi:hypothetical protein
VKPAYPPPRRRAAREDAKQVSQATGAGRRALALPQRIEKGIFCSFTTTPYGILAPATAGELA